MLDKLEKMSPKELQEKKRAGAYPFSIRAEAELLYDCYMSIEDSNSKLRKHLQYALVKLLDCEKEYNYIYKHDFHVYSSDVDALIKSRLDRLGHIENDGEHLFKAQLKRLEKSSTSFFNRLFGKDQKTQTTEDEALTAVKDWRPPQR